MTEISSEEGQKWLKELKKRIDKKREEQIKKFRISWLDIDLKNRMKDLVGFEQMILNLLNKNQIKRGLAIEKLENIESSKRYIEELSNSRKSQRQNHILIGLTVATIILIIIVQVINN